MALHIYGETLPGSIIWILLVLKGSRSIPKGFRVVSLVFCFHSMRCSFYRPLSLMSLLAYRCKPAKVDDKSTTESFSPRKLASAGVFVCYLSELRWRGIVLVPAMSHSRVEITQNIASQQNAIRSNHCYVQSSTAGMVALVNSFRLLVLPRFGFRVA